MKKIFQHLRVMPLGYILATIAIAIWGLGATITMSGCKKDRLFTHVDSIGQVPSQFHFFNAFTYDSALTVSVDGLPRQSVKVNSFSAYYPSSSAFNQNPLQPNSKQIATFDPLNNTLYNALATISLKPQTSYLIYIQGSGYDTLSLPKNTIVPRIGYLPEDTYHPTDGNTSMRYLSLLANGASSTVTIKPNIGTNTSATLQSIGFIDPLQVTRASDMYTNTQPGLKTITMQMSGGTYSGSFNALFTFLPIQLSNKKAYTFIAVGDMKNYLAHLEPRPKLFLLTDDDPGALKELTLSSLSYPGNATTTTSVNVVDGAYNLPGILNYTDAAGNLTQYYNTQINFNQISTKVTRWPLVFSEGGGAGEDVGNSGDLNPPTKLYARISSPVTLQPNSYLVRVLYGDTFTPTITSFTYNFEQGLQYTLCLVPSQTSKTTCGQLVLQNDNQPDPNVFKLRFINLMGGVPAVDVHLNAPNGPVIASSVGFAQANDYIPFPPNFAYQNLYITAAGSIVPLFQTGAKDKPISFPFRAGNSGTLYIMGLLPGVPYSGDGSAFPPFVYYANDAFFSYNSANTNQILFY